MIIITRRIFSLWCSLTLCSASPCSSSSSDSILPAATASSRCSVLLHRGLCAEDCRGNPESFVRPQIQETLYIFKLMTFVVSLHLELASKNNVKTMLSLKNSSTKIVFEGYMNSRELCCHTNEHRHEVRYTTIYSIQRAFGFNFNFNSTNTLSLQQHLHLIRVGKTIKMAITTS